MLLWKLKAFTLFGAAFSMKVDWNTLLASIAACRLCPLCETRKNTVAGEGSQNADLMFIGEGPGRDEDASGRPFVGRAGQLLTKMIEAIDMERENVYIANIVKCRPPENRVPNDSEAAACLPYLRAQVALVRPKVIVALGATAAKHVLGPDIRISRDRGVFRESKGVWLIPTYHPAYLLRSPERKRDAWEDFQAIRDKLKELCLV